MATERQGEPVPADEIPPVESNVEPAGTGEQTEAGMERVDARERHLPTEPAKPAPTTTGDARVADDDLDDAAILAELRRFHFYGDAPDAPATDALPALLHDYADLARVRHDYPLYLNDDGEGAFAEPLTAILDRLIAEASPEGDEGEIFKRHVYRIESAIRRLAEENPDLPLSALWDLAAPVLISSADSEKKRRRLEDNLAAARQSLPSGGTVIPCDDRIATRLFRAAVGRCWTRRCTDWREELASLIKGLRDILRIDFDHSPAATTAEHLRDSLGDSVDHELDFDAMSGILAESKVAGRLPDDRRSRIESALATLREVEPVFQWDPGEEQDRNRRPFAMATVSDDCAAVLGQHEARMQTMAAFFKAVRIGRLEVANHYRESVHDAFFAGFDSSYLTDEELALCPPLLLQLSQGYFAAGDVSQDRSVLLELLSSRLPVKILVQIEDLHQPASRDDSMSLAWPARLASMATALNHLYVMQAPVSKPLLLQEAFMAGVDYRGPALFSVYAGDPEHQPLLPRYLAAATASECRAFPVLVFDPARGETQAERMNILENSYPDRDWPGEAFSYSDAEENRTEIDLQLTLAELLFCDMRFAGEFWNVPRSMWHEDMTPLAELLGQGEGAAATRVPYITTVDGAGMLGRVVPSRKVLMETGHCREAWRGVQESGGINNSFALNRLAEEKERLENEKQREVEAIGAEYASKLDQDLGSLTREIVGRIASQLIAGTDAGLQAGQPAIRVPVSTPAAPAEDGAAEVEAAPSGEAEEEEEAERLVLDDPYIDTPLCTSCNDCTDLNPQMFAYDENKQAYIKDALAGPYRDMVIAAEKCPVRIIHPGRPKDPDESDLDELIERAAPFM